MDAIMLALVAVALANADGRTGIYLSTLLNRRHDRRMVAAIFFAAFLISALVAAIAGSVANRLVGQGVVALLVAAAMLSAAVALSLPLRPPADEAADDASPALLAGRTLVAQFGDRSHFLIGALAATSGAGLWAAAGGAIGWLLAMLPVLAFGPALAQRRLARLIRWGAAAVLALWGTRTALGAFGLL
jgi:putative Ca2+/H+ antiporter (TMEM165/GDT1 family)